jgi:LacI family transcriptional regulator, galactose operon repressor
LNSWQQNVIVYIMTIHEVAARAGVSTATVSRVLSGSGPVSARSRRKVLTAAKALGYRPNAIATSLRRRRTFTVGMLVPDVTNPFFSGIARTANHLLFGQGFSAFLVDTDHSLDAERRFAHLFEARRVDGLLVISNDSSSAFFEELAGRVPAIVLVDRPRSDRLDSVRVDNHAGALQAVAHLVVRGRRKIAIISGPTSLLSSGERLEGFRSALRLHNLPEIPEYIAITGFSVEQGIAETKRLLELADPPDAIFAGNNTLGIGAISALKALGRRIPEEVALIIFDDLYLAEAADPPLTVIAQPVTDIGTTAVSLLLGHLERSSDWHPREILLPPQLILRRST